MTVEESFPTNRAALLAGFNTTHMVDYLARTGVVIPTVRATPGRGRTRLYSFQDIVLLRALNRLLKKGIAVHRLKDAQETYCRLFHKEHGRTLPARYLMTDGERVLFEEEPGKIVDLTDNGQMAFAFVIDLKPILEEVNAAIKKLAQD